MLVGLDIGTTNIKLWVYDEEGNPIWGTRARTPLEFHESLKEILHPEKLWKTISKLLYSIPDDVKKKIRAIGISSLGETVFPVRKDGSSMAGLIWYNTITKEIYEEFFSQIDPEWVFKTTGLRASWIFSIFKMMYYYRSFKEEMEELETWLDVSSYIAYILTGDKRMDRCLASRTMLIDLKTGDWCEEILDIANIPRKHLPDIVDSGIPRGTVKADIALDLGFPKDVIVTTAGQDHMTASFPAGVFDLGSVLNSTGTTEAVLWGVDDSVLNTFLKNIIHDFNAGFHVVPHRYYLVDGLPTGGYCIEWFLRKVLRKDFEHLGNVKMKTNTVYFFPFLRGIFSNMGAGASFLNLSDETDSDEMLISIIESLSFEVRSMIENLRNLGLEKDYKLIMVGGESLSELVVKIRSNVLGIPVHLLQTSEATTLGAALLAGLSAGLYKDHRDAFERGHRVSKIVYPDRNTDYYEEKYQKYKKLKKELIDLQ